MRMIAKVRAVSAKLVLAGDPVLEQESLPGQEMHPNSTTKVIS